MVGMASRSRKRPDGRSRVSPFRGHASSMRVTPEVARGVTLVLSMSSVAISSSRSVRRRAEPYVYAAIAAAAFAASTMFVLRGGFNVSHRGPGDLGVAGVILVALTTLPLLAGRRSPF